MPKNTAITELRPWGGGKLSKGKPLRKFLAFTLAEVLITLGIIGLVASLTIPTLMQNTQKHQTVVALKKTYSTIQQAVARSRVDNGDVPDWDWSLDLSTFLKTYLIPYLSISKDCGQNNDVKGECSLLSKKWLDGENLDYFATNHYKILLSDGTSIAFYSEPPYICVNIIVDINADKKPNIAGKDVFFLKLYKQRNSPDFIDYNTTRNEALHDGLFGCRKDISEHAG